MIIMMKNVLLVAAGIPLLLGIVLAVAILLAGVFPIVMGRKIFSIPTT